MSPARPSLAPTRCAARRASGGAAVLLIAGALLARSARPPEGPAADGRLRLNPNTASAAELCLLPEIGEVLAGRIVAHRSESGPFRTLADLDDVPGIGPVTLRGLAANVALSDAPAAAGTP